MTRLYQGGWARRFCAVLNVALLCTLFVHAGLPSPERTNSTQNGAGAEHPTLKPRLLDSKDLDWHVTAEPGLPLQHRASAPLVMCAPGAAQASHLNGPHNDRPPPAR